MILFNTNRKKGYNLFGDCKGDYWNAVSVRVDSRRQCEQRCDLWGVLFQREQPAVQLELEQRRVLTYSNSDE